jgi:hypothetical protein
VVFVQGGGSALNASNVRCAQVGEVGVMCMVRVMCAVCGWMGVVRDCGVRTDGRGVSRGRFFQGCAA